MAFLDETFAKYSMKKLLGLAHTTNAKDPGNEAETVRNFIPASHIETYAITTTAAAVASNILDCTNVTAGQTDSQLTLTLDASSSGDGYFVGVPTGHDLLSYTNPITGSTYLAGDRVSNIITKKFGSSWRPILYDNGSEVFPGDVADWFLEETGVVTAETDLSLGATGTLSCYVYVGNTVETHVTSDGSDHTFINQNVTTNATPTFASVQIGPGVADADGNWKAEVSGTDWVFYRRESAAWVEKFRITT